jgi:single-strand DNA-binding protein
MDLNYFSVSGRLVRDAELKYLSTGTGLATFAIATNYSTKKNGEWSQEANFFDVKLFGKIAESLSKYLLKGQQVTIGGELRQERWETDGQARSKIVIIADKVILGGGKNNQSTQTEPYQESQEFFDDDVPF